MKDPKPTDAAEPAFIPPSPEGRGVDSPDPVEARQARADTFLAAAALRSPAWAQRLRDEHTGDPQALADLAQAFDLDALAGLSAPDKVRK